MHKTRDGLLCRFRFDGTKITHTIRTCLQSFLELNLDRVSEVQQLRIPREDLSTFCMSTSADPPTSVIVGLQQSAVCTSILLNGRAVDGLIKQQKLMNTFYPFSCRGEQQKPGWLGQSDLMGRDPHTPFQRLSSIGEKFNVEQCNRMSKWQRSSSVSTQT